jgi:OmpA-OmpF porin, OOP family
LELEIRIMKARKFSALSVAAASVLAAAPLAFAQTAQTSSGPSQWFARGPDAGPYLGAGIGRSYQRSAGGFALNSPSVVESRDKNDNGVSVFAGYNFDKRWAVEGGYTDLGDFTYNYRGIGVLAGTNGQANYEARSWWLAGKGTFPINDRFEVYGKLGLAFNRAEVSGASNNAALNTAIGAPFSNEKTHTGLLAGLGAEYRFNNKVGLRLDYTDYGKFRTAGSGGEARAALWSAGVTYRF